MSKRNKGGGGGSGTSMIEGVLIGIVMFLALILAVGGIIGTVMNSLNSTAIAAWNLPANASGLFDNLGTIVAIVIGIVLLLSAFALLRKRGR